MSPVKKKGRRAKASTRGTAARAPAKRVKAARPKAAPGRARRAPARKRARPALALVPKPAPKPRPRQRAKAGVTEFAGAKANATPRDLALFEMERARVAVHAAIQGLGAGEANQPISPGKWSPRQIVLHLAFWDREVIRHLEAAAARNQRPSLGASNIDTVNAAAIAELDPIDWEGAKRMLQLAREDLRDAFESIPAEPADVWSKAHAVGGLVRVLIHHDRHHADVIKTWRSERGA